MLILGALLLGAFVTYWGVGIFFLSFFSDEGPIKWLWIISAIVTIPGVWMIVWAIIQIITLSP